jgi:hypothetical protein
MHHITCQDNLSFPCALHEVVEVGASERARVYLPDDLFPIPGLELVEFFGAGGEDGRASSHVVNYMNDGAVRPAVFSRSNAIALRVAATFSVFR